MMGWFLEVFFRRYFGGARKWINPGFLSGPYLPLYGTGLCLLYMISSSSIAIWLKIVLFAIGTTLIEYITGLFFLKYYKLRLWNYSNLKLNVNGVIAPIYTFFWTVLSLFFYYILYPYFYYQIEFIFFHLEYSVFIGIVLGFMMQDMVDSFGIVNKLKSFAEITDNIVIIDYEQLKLEIRERIEGLSNRAEHFRKGVGQNMNGAISTFKYSKPTFFRPFNDNYELLLLLKEYIGFRNRNSSLKEEDKNDD